MKIVHDLGTNEYYTMLRVECEYSKTTAEERANALGIDPKTTFAEFIDKLLFDGDIEIIEVIA